MFLTMRKNQDVIDYYGTFDRGNSKKWLCFHPITNGCWAAKCLFEKMCLKPKNCRPSISGTLVCIAHLREYKRSCRKQCDYVLPL